jgi:hypothetical protein
LKAFAGEVEAEAEAAAEFRRSNDLPSKAAMRNTPFFGVHPAIIAETPFLAE